MLGFTKSKDDDLIGFDHFISYKQVKGENELPLPDVNGRIQVDIKQYLGDAYDEAGINYLDLVTEFIVLVGFLKYCDTEVKILEPKEKYRAFGVKYFNETKQKIEILDSTWFTTLVRSEGFKVRGHLRLQPMKVKGEWTKRFIWISDFEKSGYTRKAKKDSL